MRREAQLCIHELKFGANSGNVRALIPRHALTLGTKIEYTFHQTLFPCAIKRLGTRLHPCLDRGYNSIPCTPLDLSLEQRESGGCSQSFVTATSIRQLMFLL